MAVEWIGKPIALTIRLVDTFEKPVAKAKYKLEVGDLEFEGSTSEDGKLSHSIPGDSKEGTLTVESWRVKLRIGKLEPADTAAGAAPRLANLSYLTTKEAAGEPEVKEALLRFQTAHGMEPDGKLNDATQKKLREVYGG